MSNLMTETMQRITEMLINTSQKLKDITTEPYGITKLSRSEQEALYNSLTPDTIVQLIDEHGFDEVNEFLQKFEPKETQNG